MNSRQSNQFVRLQKVATFFSSRTIPIPPSGFADQVTALNTTLSTAITTYANTVSTRAQARQSRVGASKDLVVKLAAGADATKHLNAMVHRIYGNDPATMAALQQANRVGKSTASRTSTTSSATSTPTASPASAGSGTAGPAVASAASAPAAPSSATFVPTTAQPAVASATHSV